jgi:hypothetical protein
MDNAVLTQDFRRIAELTTEAYCVANGLAWKRRFSDAELQPYMEGVRRASADLYGFDKPVRCRQRNGECDAAGDCLHGC